MLMYVHYDDKTYVLKENTIPGFFISDRIRPAKTQLKTVLSKENNSFVTANVYLSI